MKSYLMELGDNVWNSVVLIVPKANETKNKSRKGNVMVINSIQNGLFTLVKVFMGSCTTIKEIWDKLHNLYTVEEVIKNEDPPKKGTNSMEEHLPYMQDIGALIPQYPIYRNK